MLALLGISKSGTTIRFYPFSISEKTVFQSKMKKRWKN